MDGSASLLALGAHSWVVDDQPTFLHRAVVAMRRTLVAFKMGNGGNSIFICGDNDASVDSR